MSDSTRKYVNRDGTVAVQHGFFGAILLTFALTGFGSGSAALAGGDDGLGASDSVVPEPAGYRMDEYRAPTPATLSGGYVLNTAGVLEILKAPGTVVVDVLPQQRRPDNLPAETLWIPKPRFNIPGSVWLPDVGRGAISESTDAYYRSNLYRLTGGDRSRSIIVYCLADCWMSWNAAKRAIEYGYTSVFWYPGGTDDWTAAGLPTEKSEAVPDNAAAQATN